MENTDQPLVATKAEPVAVKSEAHKPLDETHGFGMNNCS
jgi:hypothetical protein